MKWISVKDRMPELGTVVLATFKGQYNWVIFPAVMTFDKGLYSQGYAAPTHWMPIPDLPT